MVKRVYFSLLFLSFVILALFFVATPDAYAITHGCNGSCGGSITCSAGLSCIDGTCQPPMPTCSGASPEVLVTNRTSGNFTVTATGVANATGVVFGVWSVINGQDDIRVYNATDNGGGNWTATIDLANHSAGGGLIGAHGYLTNCTYDDDPKPKAWCDSADFTIDTTSPTCTISGPSSLCRGTSGSYSTDSVDANLSTGGIYWHKSAVSSPQVWGTVCSGSDCTGTTNFGSTSGTYYAVCNAYDTAGNKCSGNPFVPLGAGWADCGANDGIFVTVTDPPAAQSCVCGTPSVDVPDGSCGLKDCSALGYDDFSAPGVPTITASNPNCGPLTFNWTAQADVGCQGGVLYHSQVTDGLYSYNDATNGNLSFTVGAPAVGTTYKARVHSRDAGGNDSAWTNNSVWTSGVTYCCSTPPTDLSPSGTCNGPTFPTTYSWTADFNADGYYFSIPGCVTDQWLPGWTSNSYTLSAVQQTACNALATGTRSWNVRASYAGGCADSAAASASFYFDRSPPPVPVVSVSSSNCGGNVAFSWPAVSDVQAAAGCYGSVQYRAQILADGVSLNDLWQAGTSYSVGSPVVGTVYTGRALSADNGASHTNQSAWSNTSAWTSGEAYCCAGLSGAFAPLAPSGTCEGPTFPSSFSWTLVANATGYVLKIPDCSVSQPLGIVSSYTLSAAQQTACNALATGTHSWSIEATYGGGCPNSAVASATITLDKTAPSVPVASVAFTPDPACLGKYKVVQSWTAAVDVGCSGLNALPYKSEASTNSGFSSNDFPLTDWAALGSRTQTTNASYAPSTTVYSHVRSRDAKNNQSAYSATIASVVPSPTPYPTIYIKGPLTENINGTCYPMSAPGPITFTPNSANPGVSFNCNTISGGSEYECDITVNNQTGLCVTPNINVTMDGAYSGYDALEWRDSCAGTTQTLPFVVGTPNPVTPIYLSYAGSGGWFKLKDTSFNSRQSNRQSIIPYNIGPFDTDDTDLRHYVLSGKSGLLMQNGALQPGGNAYVFAGGEYNITYSEKNWFTNSYTSTNDITYQKYIDYIKARKDFTTISSLDEITDNGVYSITPAGGTLTLTADKFTNKSVVLVVKGKAQFAEDFEPSNGYVAVLASTVQIEKTVASINAILIGQTVTTGADPSTVGLKIKGNLIDESELELTRTQTDGRVPSLFVVFDPRTYLNVMPYLSTSTYDWRQLQ